MFKTNQCPIVATSVVLSLALASCGQDERKAGDRIERPGQPAVQLVGDDDPLMNAAIERARNTVDQFIAALDDPEPTQSGFSVKMPVSDGTHTEHMWVVPVRYENGRFIGAISNEPYQVTGVKLGDEVDVAPERMSDWMYVDDGRLMGGYTLRVLRDGLSAQERRQFDLSVPFTFD